jgi:CBS-domain-containing membrane protein
VGFAARRMVESGVHRVVVIDDAGAIVGIVTPIDVLRGLLDGKIDATDFARTE